MTSHSCEWVDKLQLVVYQVAIIKCSVAEISSVMTKFCEDVGLWQDLKKSKYGTVKNAVYDYGCILPKHYCGDEMTIHWKVRKHFFSLVGL